MRLFDLFIQKAIVGEGGGSQITVEPLNATENGIYNAGSGKAYNPVSVDVPEPTLISKSITENGTYNASSDNADGYSSVEVNVGYDMAVNDNQFKTFINISGSTKNGAISYCQTVADGVLVDWGDGSVEETSPLTGLNNNTCAYLTHNYQDDGIYIITLTCTEGDFSVLGRGGQISGVYSPQYRLGYAPSAYLNSIFCNCVLEISIGENFKYALPGQDNTGCITGLGALQKINGVVQVVNSSSAGDAFMMGQNNYSLKDANFDFSNFKGYLNTSINFYSLSGTVKLPSTITQLGNLCFAQWYNTDTFDFTDFTLVDGALPITFGINVFLNTNPSMSILFATQEIAEVAKQTTNLVQYATKIHYVGE